MQGGRIGGGGMGFGMQGGMGGMGTQAVDGRHAAGGFGGSMGMRPQQQARSHPCGEQIRSFVVAGGLRRQNWQVIKIATIGDGQSTLAAPWAYCPHFHPPFHPALPPDDRSSKLTPSLRFSLRPSLPHNQSIPRLPPSLPLTYLPPSTHRQSVPHTQPPSGSLPLSVFLLFFPFLSSFDSCRSFSSKRPRPQLSLTRGRQL